MGTIGHHNLLKIQTAFENFNMNIQLTSGEESLLDDLDKDLIFSHSMVWSNTAGYANAWSKILNHPVMIHILLLPKRKGFEVDHINRNKLDNRRCNLRYLTRRENARNMKFPSKNKGNTNPYTGVYIDRMGGDIYIQVSLGIINGKRKRISQRGFESLEQAAKTYDKLARIHHKEFAKLNFPNEV